MSNKIIDLESADYERQLMRNINNPEEFMRILKSIPKREPAPEPIFSSSMCAKLIVVIILAVFMLPFAISNLYYAYTDNSCVNLPAGRLAITLKDFLLVDGYYLLSAFTIVSAFIIFTDNLKKDNYNDSMLYKFIGLLVSIIFKTFTLSWLILGAVIFWKLIDNNACDNGIYNYIYAMIIIKFSFVGLELIGSNKKDN